MFETTCIKQKGGKQNHKRNIRYDIAAKIPYISLDDPHDSYEEQTITQEREISSGSLEEKDIQYECNEKNKYRVEKVNP